MPSMTQSNPAIFGVPKARLGISPIGSDLATPEGSQPLGPFLPDVSRVFKAETSGKRPPQPGVAELAPRAAAPEAAGRGESHVFSFQPQKS